MKLTHILFHHVDGFNDLSEDKKEEFIALYYEFVKSKKPHTSKSFSEEKMTSVYVTSQYNYRVSFLNRADTILRREKEVGAVKLTETEETSIPTMQVRIAIETHEKMKNQADKEGKSLREMLDAACAYYLNQCNETT